MHSNTSVLYLSMLCIYAQLNLVHTKCFTVWGNTQELVGKYLVGLHTELV